MKNTSGLKPLTVLSLHRISTDKDFFWTPIHPHRFEQLVKQLVQKYQLVNFHQLPDIKTSTRPLLILSFDDGYYDFMEYALPVLRKYKVTANHNLVIDCLTSNKVIWTQRLGFIFNHFLDKNLNPELSLKGKVLETKSFKNLMQLYFFIYKQLLLCNHQTRDEFLVDLESRFDVPGKARMMDWNDAAECLKNGVEIGSHSYTHDVLSVIQGEVELNKEFLDSRRILSERLSTEIDAFAFPNGQFKENHLPLMEKAGYKYALLVNDKINERQDYQSDSLLLINRINMINENVFLMGMRANLVQQKVKKLFNYNA